MPMNCDPDPEAQSKGVPVLPIQSAHPAVLFGVGHTYQGWRGILLTTAVGAFFSSGVDLVLFDQLMKTIPSRFGITFSAVETSSQTEGVDIALFSAGEFEKEGLDHDPSRDQLACPADDPLTRCKSVCRLGALRSGSGANARRGIGFKVFDFRQRSVAFHDIGSRKFRGRLELLIVQW
jgi:hypothetical protein